MKCPKCGFNSFEYYDSCKKCAADLSGYKQTYSIASIVLPLEAKEKLAAEFISADIDSHLISEKVEVHDDIFSFDLPGEQQPASAHKNEDPFNFEEPSPSVGQSGSSKSEDDAFSDLLESTSQGEVSPFAASQAEYSGTPAPAKASEAAAGPGEFDLESFSWDDTPVAPVEIDNKKDADDFDSLFGDMNENPPK